MLVELAIGDAYGAGFEFAASEEVEEHNTLHGYRQHPRHRGIRPGMYTDDTQLTLAVAELLLDGDPWTPENLADRLVDAYHRDPRDGYAKGFRALLDANRTGAELRAAIAPASDRSGAAMRAGPIGLLPDVDEVLRLAEIQARVTHDTPAGIESARAAALAVHYCHHRIGPTERVAHWITERLDGAEDWSVPWQGKVDALGVMCVRAALTALSGKRRLTDLLSVCIGYTGDVDTVATIALAAGSRAADVEQDLPAHLYDTLENGPFGRDYLADLDARLLDRWPGPTPCAEVTEPTCRSD
ncbi:hypothetical protein GCM10023321_05140 [Pseudonocardia eucalypti]|uniref:ADP-ribosylglycohydrolase n=1 Tax=Pseudonocardia eucalypti TaxID=648755 RepID=A0ABP9PGD4_9PSEU|nr:ADP-ribosylglycohydrolase [Pseudonocardia eucalypti]